MSYPHAPYSAQPKSKVTAGLLALLVGSFGVHHFYLGNTNRAVTMLLVSLIGAFLTCGIATLVVVVISIVEGIRYLTVGGVDAAGVELV
jgi:TM2 domain-containing membrane protein YozV